MALLAARQLARRAARDMNSAGKTSGVKTLRPLLFALIINGDTISGDAEWNGYISRVGTVAFRNSNRFSIPRAAPLPLRRTRRRSISQKISLVTRCLYKTDKNNSSIEFHQAVSSHRQCAARFRERDKLKQPRKSLICVCVRSINLSQN